MVIFALISSCSSKSNFIKLPNSKQIDKRLVGVWEGIEKNNQIEGMTKEWKMTRKPEGEFILEFKVIINKRVQKITEEGIWWVENGIFYEFHDKSGKTDTYKYEILNKDQVKFKAIKLSVEHANETYEFIDTRVN